jgi:hypothetical protein
MLLPIHLLGELKGLKTMFASFDSTYTLSQYGYGQL